MSFGEVQVFGASANGAGVDPLIELKEVYWRPSDSSDEVLVGQPVCYNSDLAADYKERTTNPVDDQAASNNSGTTYAEGAQTYDARIFVVERPSATNKYQFAGTVMALGDANGADGDKITIAVPNGAVVPVYTDASCTLDSTVLGISASDDDYQVCTNDGDPLGVAIAMETVDRSGTAGLCWARVIGTGLVGAWGGYLAPTRGLTTGYAYGINIDGTSVFTGAAASKSYIVQITGDRESGNAASGDSNDAYLKISGSNYAENDSNFILRGLNCSVSNRSGGTLGHLYGGNISISLKSGSNNISNAIALQVDAQDLTAGTKAVFGGLDIALNREGTAGTEEFGLRIRTRGTINSEIDAAIRIDKDATDHGFTNLFTIEADAVNYAACTGDVTVDANDKVIPIDLGGTTYYLIAVDSIPAG